jgi:signal transduction histidine kinase
MALRRCLTNLVENASRYGERAHVQVHDARDRLEIHIWDEGPGIPEDRLEQVFEPFYRLESSRSRATGGTGLGLSIARNVARAHGGDLVLRNRKGGGLEAMLTLPR